MKKIKIFIASPGDVKAERKIADRVISEINKNSSDLFGFEIESQMWEKDAVPDLGDDGLL